MFECLKCGKKSLFIANYFVSKFPTMFEYSKNHFSETFTLTQRR